MFISRKARVLATVLATAAFAGALSEAAAAAPAGFTPATGSTTLTAPAPLTFKVGTVPTPARTFTCTPQSFTGGTASGNPQGQFTGLRFISLCVDGNGGNGTVIQYGPPAIGMLANKSGSVFTLDGIQTPYIQVNASNGAYYATHPGATFVHSIPWVNGTSAANPSALAFSNTSLGVVATAGPLQGQPITLTGAINVSRAGALLTLS